MLPAWLGAGAALQAAIDRGQAAVLAEMVASWPFFAVRLSMLEMVFAKADVDLSAYYDSCLVPEQWRGIGDRLRQQLSLDQATVLELLDCATPLQRQPWTRESLQLRNFYTDPLNYLQAELLMRQRENPAEHLERAIMVTIAGIAAGMRNTG